MIKSILKDSFIYGILNAVNKFFLFLIFFIFVKLFQKEDIAVLDMLIVFYSMMTIFISMQLESSFARFYFNEKESDKHFDLLKTISLLMLMFCIIYTVPSYFIYQYLFIEYNINNSLVIFSAIMLVGYLYNFTSLINLHFRYSYEKRNFVISSVLFPFVYLLLISIFYLLLQYNDLSFIFLSQIIAYIFVLMYQFNAIGKEYLLASFNKLKLKDIFFYSLPMLPMFFLIFLNDKAIIFILKEFIPLKLLADFSVATKYLAFLSLFFFALRMALDPKINKFISFPSLEKSNEYKMYINIYILFSLVLFLIFITIVPYIQNYFFVEYKNAYKWASILSVSLILLNLSSYMTPGFAIKKRMDTKLIIILIQVIFNFIGFYFVLQNGYGIIMALNYLVIINFIFMIIQHYYSNKLYFVSHEYLKSSVIFIVLFLIVNRSYLEF